MRTLTLSAGRPPTEWPAADGNADLVAAAGELPAFDAHDNPTQPAVRALRASIAACDELIIDTDTTTAGAPGSLLNALILLGGPGYGVPSHTVLRGKRVRLRVRGTPAGRERAVRQLVRAARALGATDTGTAATGTAGTGTAGTGTAGTGTAATGTRETDMAATGTTATGTTQARATDRMPAAAAGGPRRRIVDLTLGHVELPHHPVLTSAIEQAAGAPSRYCDPYGHPALRQAVRRRERFLAGAGDRDVTITVGASVGIAATLLTVVPPNGIVLVPDPGYPAYRGLLRRLGYRAVGYPVPPPGAALTASDLPAAGAAAILWNSPHNPTGWVATAADLATLGEVATAHDLVVISDEVYDALVWDGDHISPVAGQLADRTVVVDSVAKKFAAAALRIGWVEAPARWLPEIAATHWNLAMSPSSTCQRAATLLLAEEPKVTALVRAHLRATWRASRPLLGDLLASRLTPAAGFFWWISGISGVEPGCDLAQRLLTDTGVRVIDGASFGPRGRACLRVSLGGPADVTIDGLSRLAGVLTPQPDGSVRLP